MSRKGKGRVEKSLYEMRKEETQQSNRKASLESRVKNNRSPRITEMKRKAWGIKQYLIIPVLYPYFAFKGGKEPHRGNIFSCEWYIIREY